MSWLQKLRDDAYHYSSFDIGFDEHGYPDPNIPHRQPTEIGYMLLVLFERAKHIWLESLCKYWYRDHDLEFQSSIGPDSGSESWYCHRCGIGGSHIYY